MVYGNLWCKIKAYPTHEQALQLSQWIGCSRVIYNCKVAEDSQNYKIYQETSQKTKVNQAYSHFKTEEMEWLKQCPSQILRNSSSNWYNAKQRFFKGIAKNPRKKKKGKRDTVLLTNELFSFKEHTDANGMTSQKLIIGTKTHMLGALKFYAHREFGVPNQIVVGKKNNAWTVSFCYETEEKNKTEQELLDEFSCLDKESLNEMTVGMDRGVAIPFQLSNEINFDFDDRTKDSFVHTWKRLKRYQKRMARQNIKSNSRKRTKYKVAKLHSKISNIRHDFCHKVSHAIVKSTAKIFAVEDLKLKNMTKAPKPIQDKNGKYLPNKKRAKAGLNKSLLSKGLVKTVSFLEYKALKHGKLVVKVPPHYSSQECAHCSHTQPENRKSQCEFFCLLCGNHDNADVNAAKVIAKRGVQFLLSKPKAKTRTRLGRSRSKARRGVHKTELEFFNLQTPMTPEAQPLQG